MIARILVALSLALLPLLPVAQAQPDCVPVAAGTACGAITLACGAGTGTGVATGVVTWRLTVSTELGSSSMTLRAPAAQLAARTVCTLPGCTTVTLTADGQVVDGQTLCWA